MAVNPSSTTDPIVRYNSTGTPDGTTFDTSSVSGVSAIGVQSLAWNYQVVAAGSGFSVVRYNSDGSRDTTFGNQGTATASINGTPSQLLVQADGKIVLVGLVPEGSGYDLELVRYTAGGLLDSYANDTVSPFGDLDGGQASGIVTVPLGAVPDACDAALQTGDRIVVAVPSGTGSVNLLGYNAAGQLDTTVSDDRALANPILAAEADGNILLAESASGGFTLRQYDGNALGSDSAFGTVTGPFSQADAMAVEPSGRILVAGVDSVMGQWALARFSEDGNLDTSLVGSGTNNGILDSGITGAPAAMALEPDGEILLAGANTAATDAALALFTSGGLGVQVNDVVPTILTLAGSPTTSGETGTATLGGTFTDPVAGESYYVLNVDWGDGSDQSTQVLTTDQTPFEVPAHEYAATGNYTITATVTDLYGSSSSPATTTVNVVSSGLAISLPQVVNVGDQTFLGGDFAGQSTAGPRTVIIDWGDGTSSSPDTTTMTLDASQTSFQSPPKQYAASGSYTIAVSVQDASGNYYAPVTQTLTVLDAPPQLTVAGGQTAVVGQELVIANLAAYVGSLDPSGDNSLTYSIDWGDGTAEDTGVIGDSSTSTPASGTLAGSHAYTAGGNYQVTVEFSGANTGAATDTFDVTAGYPSLSVQNLLISPTVLIGQVATLTGDVCGLAGSSFTLVVNWGQNQGAAQSYAFAAGTSSFSIPHYYLDASGSPFAATYAVSATVTTPDNRTFTVPTSTTGVDYSLNVACNGGRDRSPGGTANLSAIVLHPGDNESYTYTWSVTDDEDSSYSYISSGPSTFSFDPPNANDDYNVAVTAMNADGESDTAGAWLCAHATGGPGDFHPDQPTVSIAECDADGDLDTDPVLAGADAYFLVSVSGDMPAEGPVTVYYQTQDGSAKAATDYTPRYGDQALTLAYDSTTGGYDPATITVETTAGAPVAANGSAKTFSVVITRVYDCEATSNGSTTSNSATASIANAELVYDEPEPAAGEDVWVDHPGDNTMETMDIRVAGSLGGMCGLDYNSGDLAIYAGGSLVTPGEPVLSATSQTIDLKGLVADTSLEEESITLLYFPPATSTGSGGEGSGSTTTAGGDSLDTKQVTTTDVSLWMNGVNITDATPFNFPDLLDVEVGQKISLSVKVTPAPAPASLSYCSWDVPGVVIEDFQPTTPSVLIPYTGGEESTVDCTTHFVWVDGAPIRRVTAHVELPSGQTVDVHADFDVEAPQVNVTTKPFTGGINGTVVVVAGNKASASFGNFGGPTYGLICMATKPADWNYCFAQTVATDAFWINAQGQMTVNAPPTEGLDTSFPYNKLGGGIFSPSSGVPATFRDSPGFYVKKGESAWYSVTFETWYMGEPIDSNGNVVGDWVPLEKLTWSYYVCVEWPARSLAPSITMSSAHVGQFAPTTDFPEWDAVCSLATTKYPPS